MTKAKTQIPLHNSFVPQPTQRGIGTVRLCICAAQKNASILSLELLAGKAAGACTKARGLIGRALFAQMRWGRD
jgi:hypothetical protein